jgi:hypothetical protein
MKLRILAVLCSLSLTTAPAIADPCVKIRRGESDVCMTFSASAKRQAARYGLQLAAPFEANKRILLKQGWVLDTQSLTDADADPTKGKEMSCGSGWDAVCQSAFRRGKELLVLTLSGVNRGLPLVAAEVAEFAPPVAPVARTLTTASFIVHIEMRCADGTVTCDDVGYRGTSRKTGKSIELRGKTRHKPCADGVAACGLLGYEFWNGKTYYRVLDEGRLSVLHQNKVVLEESGTWH